MSTANATNNTTDETYSYTADMLFSVLYIVSMIVGVPGNVLALRYFLSHKKDITHKIYIVMIITDIVVFGSVFPVIWSYLNDVEAGLLFGNNIFCQ